MKKKIVALSLMLASVSTMMMAEGGSSVLFPGFEAPDFKINSSNTENIQLSKLTGNYVLVQFWATYDAQSTQENVALWGEVRKSELSNLKMVSINFDPIDAVYKQTVRAFGLEDQKSVRETDGVYSSLYGAYELSKGFTNYLIDENGVIVAQNVSPEKLMSYIGK